MKSKINVCGKRTIKNNTPMGDHDESEVRENVLINAAAAQHSNGPRTAQQ